MLSAAVLPATQTCPPPPPFPPALPPSLPPSPPPPPRATALTTTPLSLFCLVGTETGRPARALCLARSTLPNGCNQ